MYMYNEAYVHVHVHMGIECACVACITYITNEEYENAMMILICRKSIALHY